MEGGGAREMTVESKMEGIMMELRTPFSIRTTYGLALWMRRGGGEEEGM